MNPPVEQARSDTGRSNGDPGARRAPSDHPELDAGQGDWWVCRTCRNPITRQSAQLRADERQMFANPHGLVFEIITVASARGLVGVGEITAEFSWFAGYAWQVVCCARCLTHLGWHYTAAAPGRLPPDFFGLLLNELALERD